MSQKLDIILIAPLFPPHTGGGGMQAFYLARALGQQDGVRVHVIAGGNEEFSAGYQTYLSAKRVQVERVDFSTDLSGVPFSRAIQRCLDVHSRLLNAAAAKRIVVHGQHFAGIFVGLHLKRRFNTPLVATIHKTPIGDAFGQNVSDHDPAYAHLSVISDWPIDAFIAGSTYFKQELENLSLQGKTHFIHHGIDTEWLHSLAKEPEVAAVRQELGLTHDTKLVVCPVRLDRRKRLEDFFAAAAIVEKDMNNKPIRFLVTALASDDEQRGRVDGMAIQAGMKTKPVVREIPFEKWPALLKSADACVVPTLREGLGLSVIEALALKVPVIATNAPGISEVLKTDESGLLYPAGEHEFLARLLIKILRNRGYARKLADGGAAVVRDRFRAQDMAKRHSILYKALLAHPSYAKPATRLTLKSKRHIEKAAEPVIQPHSSKSPLISEAQSPSESV